MVRICLILMVSFVVCYIFSNQISEFLLAPLRDTLTNQNKQAGQVIFLSIFDKVLAQFQVALWSGIILSCPLWFYQVWTFVAPGLYEAEKKMVAPFLGIGLILFVLGVLFGYYLAFPFTFQTLMQFGVSDVSAMISLRGYLVEASKILVLLGIIFQLPNVLIILGLMGLVTKYSLAKIRSYVYFGLAVASAVLTPADIMTMIALWIPLVLLYELGILAVAIIVHPYLAKRYA